MSQATAPPRSDETADRAAPFAFASTDAQERERLRSAALRSAPRPSVLEASIGSLRGAGPQRLREWAWQARALARHVLEPLPAELRAGRGLAGAGDAVAVAHFPSDPGEAVRARERLAFEELFLHQAALAARRQSHDAARP